MFNSFSRSWELVKASYSVLKSDKELVIFPIVSFIGSVLVTIVFLIPIIAAGVFDSLSTQGRASDGMGIVSIVIMFIFYVVMYTVIFFCNTALVGAAMIRLNGGDPTLRDGFKIAQERLGKIIGYAIINATVGMVLRALSERAGLLGRIVIGIIGMVWNIATFLVVPVLVVENVGPIDAVKRSTALLKKTWGEQLAANFGFGAVFGLISVGVMLVGFLLIGLFASIKSSFLVILAIIAMVIALIAIGLFSSALSGIYQAALYRYASEGVVVDSFSPDMIQGAFQEKAKRGIF